MPLSVTFDRFEYSLLVRSSRLFCTTKRQLLQDFDFANLFIEVLGWSNPSSARPVAMEIEGETYQRKMVAELSGVVVLEITAADGKIPEAKVRRQVHKAVAELHLENLLIFVDKDRTQSLWYWVKREGKKLYPREHIYVKGQPGDLFLGKISALVVDFSELEDGLPSVVAVAQKLQQGLDVERVTKRFFDAFQKNLTNFMPQIEGIENEADRRWYASVILNRLMFVYFLQRKQFVDGDVLYLQNKLALVQGQGKAFYQDFLLPLFFEGFAKPEYDREEAAKALLGQVKYLNGGLFLKHRIEQTYPNIAIPNGAFEAVFELFAGYSWNLDDTPGGKDDEINPGVLGYIFEKYINQKEFGAYYTRPEITEYLCDRTINQLILDKVKAKGKTFESIGELTLKLDADLCTQLLHEILPVIPSGIYTDLGTKQLREMLFSQSNITGLFCFENRKEIFEGVHRSFKFVILTFEKGNQTKSFPTAFMRLDVRELEGFPSADDLSLSVDLVRQLSPDSFSIMEFRGDQDMVIARKMLKFPLLGEKIEGNWNLRLSAEFHMTNDSRLFKTKSDSKLLPLYETSSKTQMTL